MAAMAATAGGRGCSGRPGRRSALRSILRGVLLVALLMTCRAENPNTFNVGGVLSNNDSATHFREIIEVPKIELFAFKGRPGTDIADLLLCWPCCRKSTSWTSTCPRA